MNIGGPGTSFGPGATLLRALNLSILHAIKFLTYFNPHYKEKRARAKANGESEWEVTREKQLWLQRFAAAIACGNRALIDASVSDTRRIGGA